MRTNYSTPTSARSEKTKADGTGATGQTAAWTKNKPVVIDRDFSDADQWPSHTEPEVELKMPAAAEMPVQVEAEMSAESDSDSDSDVLSATATDEVQPESDSSHQGYFAEWIQDAEAAATPLIPTSDNTQSSENVADDGVQHAAVESVDPGGDLDSILALVPEPSASRPKITESVRHSSMAPIERDPEHLPVDFPVKLERQQLPAANDQFSPATRPPAPRQEGVNLTLADEHGIEELARKTGGYEALAPEQLAVDQPETDAFDKEVLAHDPTYSASFEQLVEKEKAKDRNRERANRERNDKTKSAKILDVFDRPEPTVQSIARRTVDHPHLLMVESGEHATEVPAVHLSPEGSPLRKAAMLGLVAVVALVSVGVSVQRSRSAEPVYDVASVVGAAATDSEVRSQVLSESVEPTTTTTTMPTTTTADPDAGPELESRKGALVDPAQITTTTVELTTTQKPTTTKAPQTTAAAVVDLTADAESTTTVADTDAGAETTETTAAEETTTTIDEATTTSVDEATTTSVEETTTTEEQTTTTVAAAEEAWVDSGYGVSLPPVLIDIRYCESRGDYQAANKRSSARGAYQFLTGSWKGYGHADRYGVAYAHLASEAQQDEAALKTWQADGTRPWNASKSCWSKNPVQ